MSAVHTQAQRESEPMPAQLGPVARADVVPALAVLGAVAVLGLPLGVLWCWLAPPELVARVVGGATPGAVLPFAGQDEHRFDDMATFVLLGLAAGVLTGAALWMLRRHRGPLVLLAAVAGSLIAGWLAMRTGLWLVASRYPDLGGTGAPFARPPVLQSAWVIVTQPFGVAFAYSITTAWNGTDDLSSN